VKVMNSLKVLILACAIGFVTVTATAQVEQMAAQQRGAPVQQRGLTPDKLLSLGDFYYRSNDISDAADRYYRQAIRNAPAGSQTAGYAQYNRGSYWFRKFYVMKEQYSKEDRMALTEAEGQYYDFIDKFARQTNTIGLLADAEFYLALVYLQQGRRDYAVGWLNRMDEAAKEDQAVYVYKVVWTSKPGDIVDRNVDAAQLAVYARQSIQRGGDMNAVVLDIKRWCQRR
jgi:tetratricopeptide (TPR) repeat protein